MIKEVVLRDFPTWDAEKQLKEYQAYKALGDYSPFDENDYTLMEMIMNNPNASLSVECDEGVCNIIKEDDNSLDETIENEITNDEEIVEGVVTQDYVDTLSKKLKKIGKRYPKKVVDEDAKVYDDVFEALAKAINSPEKLWKEISEFRGSIDYDITLKGTSFIIDIDDNKINTKKLLDIADSYGIYSASQMAINIDDNVEDIDKNILKMAEKLSK